MANPFSHPDDGPPTTTPKAPFLRDLRPDVGSQLRLETIELETTLDKHRAAEGAHDIYLPSPDQARPFYARSIASKRRPPKRPDPEDLFDMLLARRGQPIAHPAKISSLLLGLAGIIVHDLFRTSENDEHVAAVPSYLALSPLYGCNQEAQDSVRTKVDGKLKTDTFAEVDIVNQPPQVAALLVCFCRFHNKIASHLALIDENGRFTLPPQDDSFDRLAYKDLLVKRDNDLFQTARSITCGLYMQIVLNDYIRTILSLQRVDTDWEVNPREGLDTSFCGTKLGQARGNQISLELNLTYRWHSAISTKDQYWLEQHIAKLLPGVKVEDMTAQDMLLAMRQFAAQQPSDPSERTWAGLQRQHGRNFDDADLIKILTDTTKNVAASFGPRQVPTVLKVVEIMGIQQARAWGVASLNEVQGHFGLTAHKSFTDINSDPEIATSLEVLYGNVDDVELYPGVVVEESKVPMTTESGPCTGFFTTRAILFDAINLIQGDRFYTVDYTPNHLTAFGYKEVSNDPSIAGGGVMYKLLMRALLYALYPFTIPSETRETQRSLGYEADYHYDAPTLIPPPRLVSDWSSIDSILRDSRSFIAPWETRLQSLGGHQGTSANAQDFAKERSSIRTIILGPPDFLKEFSCYVEKGTIESIRKNSHRVRNFFEVDVVNSVATSTWAASVAHLLGIPLNGPYASQALFSTESLQETLTVLFRYIFSYSKLDSMHELALRRDAAKAYGQLRKVVGERHRRESSDDILSEHGSELLQRLLESGKTLDEVVSLVALLAVQSVIPSVFAIVRSLDLLLSEPYETHWTRIKELSRTTAPWTSEALRIYVLEVLRRVPPAAPCLRLSDTYPGISDWRYAQAIKKGDTLLLDFAVAGRDGQRFPRPGEMKLDRPLALYDHIPSIDGLHGPLVKEIAIAGLAEQLRVFGKLDGLRRAPGAPGTLRKVRENGVVSYLNDAQDEWVPLPPSLKLRFDTLP